MLKRKRSRQNHNSYETLESRSMLAAITVGSAAEFVAAVDTANSDPEIDLIRFVPSLESIEIESTVEYTGVQKLAIDGNDVVVQPVSGAEQTFDLFKSSGGGDLVLRELTFSNGLDGVLVEVPADAVGVVNVRLSEVFINGSAEFGLHVDDLAGSDASVRLTVVGSEFIGNGVGALDFDGIRVDERGEGGIQAYFRGSAIDGNGGDGLELDEAGNGDVRLRMMNTTLNENGFFNEEDLDDGLDIDEAGEGSVVVHLRDVTASDNLDEGIDLDEEEGGAIVAHLMRVEANNNLDEGIKFSEEGNEGIWARFNFVNANGNGDDGIELEESEAGNVHFAFDRVFANENGDEGIQVEEAGEGRLFALLARSDVSSNEGNGLDLSEDENGSLWLMLRHSRFNGNGGDGVVASESGDGNLRGLILRSMALENEDYGFNFEQADVGEGFVFLNRVRLDGNGLGPWNADGVTVRRR